MALHRARHLDLVAIVGCEEVGADEKKDDLVAIHVLVDRVVDVLTCPDPAIVPSLNHTLALKHGELLFEPIPQLFIGVRV
ncbi:hypothetical protein D3C72_2373390 [compost metagenome]